MVLRFHPDMMRATQLLHLTTSREIAEILLKHGAKIDARNNRGQTALYLCSRKGFSQVAELLLKKGAANVLASESMVKRLSQLEAYLYSMSDVESLQRSIRQVAQCPR